MVKVKEFFTLCFFWNFCWGNHFRLKQIFISPLVLNLNLLGWSKTNNLHYSWANLISTANKGKLTYITGKFQTEVGKAWASEIASRRKQRWHEKLGLGKTLLDYAPNCYCLQLISGMVSSKEPIFQLLMPAIIILLIHTIIIKIARHLVIFFSSSL